LSFQGWALDSIGQIHPSSLKGHKYILAALDYFTKWAEAIALRNVDQGDIINFIEQNIIFQFGILETLTTDRGTIFTGRKVIQYVNSRNIKLLNCSPYYAQANGQVKAINKILISLIKKHVGQKPRSWNESLDQVL